MPIIVIPTDTPTTREVTTVAMPETAKVMPSEQTSATPAESTTVSFQSVPVTFSLDADYDYYTNGQKGEELKVTIITAIAATMNISASRITNMLLRPGSIVVSFVLLSNEAYPNEANITESIEKLKEIVSNGQMSIKLPDGTILKTIPDSFIVGVHTTTSPTKKIRHHKHHKFKKSTFIAIIVVSIVVSILFAVFVRFVLIVRQRRRKVAADRPTSARILIVDSIELEEKDAKMEKAKHIKAKDKKIKTEKQIKEIFKGMEKEKQICNTQVQKSESIGGCQTL